MSGTDGIPQEKAKPAPGKSDALATSQQTQKSQFQPQKEDRSLQQSRPKDSQGNRNQDLMIQVYQDEIQRQQAIMDEIQRQKKGQKLRFDLADNGPESPKFKVENKIENRLMKGNASPYELPSTKKDLMLPDSYIPKPFQAQSNINRDSRLGGRLNDSF